MGVAEKLERKFGENLGESLGVRKVIPITREGEREIPTSGPDDGRTRNRQAGFMEISNIIPDPNQPRKDFPQESIERLAASITKHGQLMPIRIRWNQELAKWIVITGERRYRAALQAGLESIACIFIEDELSSSEILQEQLIENCLREDLKPIEQARAYEHLMQLNHWTARELSESLHISPATVSRALTTLTLPEDVQEQVDAGAIPPSAAYEIAKLDSQDEQRELAEEIVARRLTREATVKAVRTKTGRVQGEKKPGRPTSTHTFKTETGKVTVTIHRKRVKPEDLIAILQSAIQQLKSRIGAKRPARQ
jgi:ParB family chromosome partitioning protein